MVSTTYLNQPRADILLVTGTIAAGATTPAAALLAAPGAGIAYRIFGWVLSYGHTGSLTFHLTWDSSNFLPIQSPQNSGGSFQFHCYDGVVTAANKAVSAVSSAVTVSVPAYISILYKTEKAIPIQV